MYRQVALVTLLACLASTANGQQATANANAEAAKAKAKDGWTVIFDGKSMKEWSVLKEGEFEDAGKVHIKDGSLVLEEGNAATGVAFKGKMPKIDYELTFKARRTDGSDFFCGLTFPVEKQSLTLILGGWGGWVYGLSCIDGFYAIDNETCDSMEFKNGQWYDVKIHCSAKKVTVWIDGKQRIDLETEGRKLTVSDEMEACLPLGIATWNTTGEIKQLRWRSLKPKEK